MVLSRSTCGCWDSTRQLIVAAGIVRVLTRCVRSFFLMSGYCCCSWARVGEPDLKCVRYVDSRFGHPELHGNRRSERAASSAEGQESQAPCELAPAVVPDKNGNDDGMQFSCFSYCLPFSCVYVCVCFVSSDGS